MKKNLFIILIFNNIAVSQNKIEIKGVIIDKVENTNIQFVPYGIAQKGIGNVSNENGYFQLHLDSTNIDDTVSFSLIGYNKCLIPVLKLMSMDTVFLEKLKYEIETIEILENYKGEKLIKIGTKKPDLGLSVFSIDKNENGTELGYLFRIPFKKNKSTSFKVNTLLLELNEILTEDIKIRVKFYSIKNGLPDTLLNLKNNTYIINKNSQKIILDISGEKIKVENNFLTSIEFLDNEKSREKILFLKGNIFSSPIYTYIKDGVFEIWKKQSINVCFALEGKIRYKNMDKTK